MSGKGPEGPDDGERFLDASRPSHFINRRWRTPRPGDLHPRRRATDRQPEAPPEPEDPFDPETLFRSDPIPPIDDTPSGPVEPWATLGLGSDATWEQVVARHRELAKQHHPDLHGAGSSDATEAADTMATVNAAFAELGRIYRITGDR